MTLYLGSQTHDQYAGPAPIQEMAQTILACIGPSGPNKVRQYKSKVSRPIWIKIDMYSVYPQGVYEFLVVMIFQNLDENMVF